MNLGAAKGQLLRWVDTRTESGFSNFLFVDRHYRSSPILRRILSLARLHEYQSLSVEELSEADCQLLQEENDALRLRANLTGTIVHRLGFWKCAPNSAPNPDDFVGYAVVKTDQVDLGVRDYVYEAVLPPVRGRAENYYLHASREYDVETPAGSQTAAGVLYAQQNDLTFVCAHVALRSALATMLPAGEITYKKMNDIVGVDHSARKVGGGPGLEPDDLERIIDAFGVAYKKVVHEPSEGHHLSTEFQRDVYGFIESGCPALVGFELNDPTPGGGGAARHIVPVIGHTFNNDAWVPEAQRAYFGSQLSYFPSESWLSSYVLHDDNFGPYYCLPRHFLKKDNFRLIIGLQRARTATTAVEAEVAGFALLQAIATTVGMIGNDWFDRFIVYAREGLLVLRTLLVERDDYLGHVRGFRFRDDQQLEAELVAQLATELPERFWMIEASAPELFTASRRKFGELLLASATPLVPLNASLVHAARLPGAFFRFSGSGLSYKSTSLVGHTGIFEANSLARC